MIFPALVLGLVLLFLLAFLIKEFLGVGDAQAPFVAVCAVIVWLLGFALLHALTAGAVALYALTLIGTGVRLLVKKRLGALRAFAGSYPAVFFLAGSLIAALLVTVFHPHFTVWDELSHWGPFFKLAFSSHALAMQTPAVSNLVHPSYPQAAVLFYYFFARLTPAYSEPAVYWTNAVLLLSCVTCLTGRIGWKRRASAVLAFGALPLLFCLFVETFPYFSVYQDCVLGAFGGAILSFGLAAPVRGRRRTAAAALALFAWVQVKDIALLFALMACLVFIALQLFGGGRGHALRKTAVSLLLPAVSAASYFLWKAATASIHGDAQASVNLSAVVSFFQRLIFRHDAGLKSSLTAYFMTVEKRPVLVSLGCPAWALFVLFTAGGVFLGALCRRRMRSRAAVCLSAALPVLCAGYLGVLFFLYHTSFAPDEAAQFASFERYASSFFIMWLMVLVGMALECAGGAVFYRDPGLLMLGALCTLVYLMLPFCFNRALSCYTQLDRARYDAAGARFAPTVGQSRVLVLSQGDSGLAMFTYHYVLLPARVVTTLYSVRPDMTQAAFDRFLEQNGVGYVVVDRSDQTLQATLAPLFSDGLAGAASGEPCLYRVAQTAGGVRLESVG